MRAMVSKYQIAPADFLRRADVQWSVSSKILLVPGPSSRMRISDNSAPEVNERCLSRLVADEHSAFVSYS